MPRKSSSIPVAERFWKKVDTTGDCWLWTASVRGSNHYGAFWLGGRHQPAHRVAWELTFGPVPDGFLVCHTCDVPLCVRPEHLFLGTPADNTADMIRKGRKSNAPHLETRRRGSSHPQSRITEQEVRELRREWLDGETTGYLSAKYGLTTSAAHRAAIGRTWSHVPIENEERQKPRRNSARGERIWTAKLTQDDVREMRSLYDAGVPAKELAERFGIHLRTTFSIVARKSWKHVV